MRGDDNRRRNVQRRFSREARTSQSSVAAIRKMVDEILKEMSRSLRSCTPKWGDHRLHPNGCFGPCCCRSSIRCAANKC